MKRQKKKYNPNKVINAMLDKTWFLMSSYFSEVYCNRSDYELHGLTTLVHNRYWQYITFIFYQKDDGTHDVWYQHVTRTDQQYNLDTLGAHLKEVEIIGKEETIEQGLGTPVSISHFIIPSIKVCVHDINVIIDKLIELGAINEKLQLLYESLDVNFLRDNKITKLTL